MNRRQPVQLNQTSETVEDIKRELALQNKKNKRIKRMRRFKRFLMLCLVAALAYGVYVFDESPMSRYRTIKVTGNQFYTEAEILAQAEIELGSRMFTAPPFLIQQRLKKLPLVDKLSVNVYYDKGYLSIEVDEVKAVAYSKGELIQLYFSNGVMMEANGDSFPMIANLPILHDFKEDAITAPFLEKLGELPDEAFLAISEIYSTPKSLDPGAMKMVMNDGYFVYLSIETLPMLGQYATLLNGANEFNKCIDMIEYGPDESSQTAIVRRCETN